MPGVVTARESTNNLPAGLLVRADHASIARVFGALVPLQPVAWTDDGLICAPRLAPEAAAVAVAACPLPTVPAHVASGRFPDSPAAMVSGWYRRSDAHAPAPPGVRELVQVAGEGFGPGGHATTAMCLAAIDHLTPLPAVDVGCGSGLLTQAWVRLHAMPVHALDLDPAAIRQCAASLRAAELDRQVTLTRGPVEALPQSEFAGCVLLANIPADAHRALLRHLGRAVPSAVVASGLRPVEATGIVAAYRRLGLRHIRAMRRGRFDCHVLVAA